MHKIAIGQNGNGVYGDVLIPLWIRDEIVDQTLETKILVSKIMCRVHI